MRSRNPRVRPEGAIRSEFHTFSCNKAGAAKLVAGVHHLRNNPVAWNPSFLSSSKITEIVKLVFTVWFDAKYANNVMWQTIAEVQKQYKFELV